MKLYIMRHGETPWNAQFRLQGGADIGLNEKGIKLAKVTGDALRDISFDLCITSPLIRAKETARYLLGDRYPSVPVVEDKRIQEISFGEWEGRCCKAGKEEIPLSMLDDFFHHTKRYIPPKGGETIADILHRTQDFYEELLTKEEYQDNNILITSHGCAVRALLQNVYSDKKYDFWHGKVPPNCSVNIVNIEKGQASLLAEDVVYY